MSKHYLKKITYSAKWNPWKPDRACFDSQEQYLHRYGSILEQPEITTRHKLLLEFIARSPDLHQADDDTIYWEFARGAKKIHAYRAIALSATSHI